MNLNKLHIFRKVYLFKKNSQLITTISYLAINFSSFYTEIILSAGSRPPQFQKNHAWIKKNVVKNFVKAFRGFICYWGNSEEMIVKNFVKNKEELYNIRRVWLEKEKKIKFNNGFIKQLLVDK